MLYHLKSFELRSTELHRKHYAHCYNLLRSFLTPQILQFYHHSYFVIALLTP
jgi:hypothetical protein